MKTRRFANDVLALSTGAEVEWKPNGGVWLSLHTEDPGIDGTQSTHEMDYPGYERIFIESGIWDDPDGLKSALELRWPKAKHEMKGEKLAKFIGLGLKGVGDGYLGRRLKMDAPMPIRAHTIPAVEKGGLSLSEA